MEKTSLLLTNYPSIYQNATFEQIGGTDSIDLVTGYDISGKIDKKAVTKQIANDIILGILSYDEIYVEASHLWDVMQVWGSEYVKELLRLRILRVVNDATLNPVMLRRNMEKWHPDFFPFTQEIHYPNTGENISFRDDIWSNISVDFHRHNFKGLEADTILLLIDEGAVKIDEKKIGEIATKETNRDILSQQFYDQFKKEKGVVWARASFERVVRLQELNKTCAIAAFLNADSIRCDGEINTLLSKKTDSIVSNKFPDGISSLNRILYDKKFPELGSLFVDRIISLDELLKLRHNFQGKLFRYWLNQKEYEEREMRSEIMNTTNTVLGNRISQFVRWMGCNMLGIINTPLGVVASTIDSFILNKISAGWHPNFFLDNRVKKLIDESMKRHEEKEKRARYKQTFNKVGRNDKCPCGSGKKFKHCHGKF